MAETNGAAIKWLKSDEFNALCVSGYTRLDHCPEIVTACRVIAETIASMTIHLMADTDRGDQRIQNELSRKLDINPNRFMTRKTFMETLVMNELLYGHGNSVVVPLTKNGLLDGPMHFSRKITEDGKTKTDVYDFQFKEGYLTGKATNLKIGDWIFTYQCDENAIPVGIWKKKPDRKGLNWVECAVYTDGKISKSYSEVPSTGDRTETSSFVFPSDLLDGIRKLLEYPGDMKEQPIRSSVNEIKSKISPRYDEALKYGLIGVRGYVY